MSDHSQISTVHRKCGLIVDNHLIMELWLLSQMLMVSWHLIPVDKDKTAEQTAQLITIREQ